MSKEIGLVTRFTRPTEFRCKELNNSMMMAIVNLSIKYEDSPAPEWYCHQYISPCINVDLPEMK